MVYRVLANGVDILGSETDSALLNPSLQTELNSAGSFNFTLPPDHPAYDDVNLLTTMIEVYEDGDLIFFGRPSEISIDWFNQKKVVCEGALAYLNDTVLRPHVFEGALISDVFKHIITQHNAQVAQNRQIIVGNITITDRYVYTDIGYDNCLSVLKSTCIDSTGGYLFIRLEENETIYIDWLKEVPYASDQTIQFASNLLDLKQELKAEDVCTVVLPLGGQIDGVDLTIASVNEGSDILEDTDAIGLYGRVTKVQQWSDIQDADALKDKAQEWLTEEQYDKLTIEVNAAELHYLDGSVGAFKIGQMVEVVSGPHNITKEVPILKMDINLDSGVKKATLGTPPREDLTEISSGMHSSGGYSSSSGGGGGSSNVRDVLVNGSSVVSDHVARISVPTDTVTASQMNTAINNAVSPKANTSDVTAALALKANISDVNTALAAKANTSDVTAALSLKADKTEIIEVVANPSGTPTDDLETIQIGNVVYDISGGSSSDGQKFVCDLIFENSPLPAPQSATSGIVTTYTLNKSIDDYDAVYIIALTGYFSQGNVDNCDSVKEIIFKSDYYSPKTTVLNSSYTDGRWINIAFTDSTSVLTNAWASDRYYCPILYKIYGIKFASNVVNNHYLSDYYSTEERVVGRWTDGKPLYQKTEHIVLQTPISPQTETIIQLSTIPNIEKFTYSKIIGGNIGILPGTEVTGWEVFITDTNATVDYALTVRKIGPDFIKVYTGSNYGYFSGIADNRIRELYITRQYTKTTDAAGTGPTPGNLIYLPALYSEEEREVGVWTDGKPLYQKSFTIQSIPKNIDTVVASLSSGNVVKDIKCFYILNYTGGTAYVNASYYSANDDQYRCWARGTDILCNWISSDANMTCSAEITVQYTKTTDQPGSGKYLPDGSYSHHYSSTEQVVGTWIDGSTVYEKTINGGITFSANDTWYDTGITGISKVISFECSLSRDGEQIGDGFSAGRTDYVVINNALKVKSYNLLLADNYTLDHLVVRYTKTI